jgi:hypothetical protein
VNCLFWCVRMGHMISFYWTGEDVTSHLMGIAGKPHATQIGSVTWWGSLN